MMSTLLVSGVHHDEYTVGFRCTPRPEHEVRDSALEPVRVLPRTTPAVTLPQLPQPRGE